MPHAQGAVIATHGLHGRGGVGRRREHFVALVVGPGLRLAGTRTLARTVGVIAGLGLPGRGRVEYFAGLGVDMNLLLRRLCLRIGGLYRADRQHACKAQRNDRQRCRQG